MHSDRTGPSDRRALPSVSDRVVGLGAPVSVVIRPDRRELPILSAVVTASMAEHEAERPVARVYPTRDDRSDLRQWEGEHQAWQAMLDSVARPGEGDVELLWPTTYAAPVLHAAVAAAERAQQATPDDAEAARTLESARATFEAFQAVDKGGLQDVHL